MNEEARHHAAIVANMAPGVRQSYEAHKKAVSQDFAGPDEFSRSPYSDIAF